MKKAGIITFILIVLFGVFTAVKLTGNKQKIEKSKEIVDRSHIPVAVNVEIVKKIELIGNISRPAVVEPNETAGIAANMPGKLEVFNVELGTKVTKGQIVGRIDTKAMQIQKQTLELTVQKMKTDYLRNKELFEGNALSEMQYLDSKYGFEARQLELQQLEQQLSDANIKSPISGTIVDKRNLAGEFVGAGTPLATVVDVNLLKVFVYLNQSEVRFIALGQDVEMTSTILQGEVFTGKVSYIAPNTDQNFNYKVEIRVPVKDNPNLKAGTYVNVAFQTDMNENVLQIPKKALVEGVKNAYVYVQNGDYAERREVQVGRENGEYIEVIGGLKEGEKVVVDGQINIVDKSFIQAKEIR